MPAQSEFDRIKGFCKRKNKKWRKKEKKMEKKKFFFCFDLEGLTYFELFFFNYNLLLPSISH